MFTIAHRSVALAALASLSSLDAHAFEPDSSTIPREKTEIVEQVRRRFASNVSIEFESGAMAKLYVAEHSTPAECPYSDVDLELRARSQLADLADLYDISEHDIALGFPSLRVKSVNRSRGASAVTFQQVVDGLRVEKGDLTVKFTPDGRLRQISGFFATPINTAADRRGTLSARTAFEEAVAIANDFGAPEGSFSGTADLVISGQELRPVWYVNVRNRHTEPVLDETVILDAESRRSIRHYSNDYDYSATVRHFNFVGGDWSNFSQSTTSINSLGTSGSNRWLEHTYFWMANSQRCVGTSLETCSSGVNVDANCGNHVALTGAYDPASGAYIEPTHQVATTFDVSPNGNSTAHQFTEQNTFFWLADFVDNYLDNYLTLPVPPDSKVQVIVNSCWNRYHGLAIETWNNLGETDYPQIWLAAGMPGGSSDANHVCAGSPATECAPNNGVLAHEFQHFWLDFVWGFDSQGMSCTDESLSVHEGATGAFLPHAYWVGKFGSSNIGYASSNTRLWRSDTYYGIPHKPGATANQCVTDYLNMGGKTRFCASEFPCNGGSGSQYRRGRVLGQPLWEAFWGVDCNTTGASCPKVISNANVDSQTWKDDFNEALFDAISDSKSGNVTFQEIAQEFVAYLRYEATAPISSSDAQDLCNIFGHHGISCNVP